METKFNSREIEALDLTPAVADVLTKKQSVEAKIESIKSELEQRKKNLAYFKTELISVNAALLAGKISEKENDTLRQKLDFKIVEVEKDIEVQTNNLKSALQALEILNRDLVAARSKALSEALDSIDVELAPIKAELVKTVDKLLVEANSVRDLLIKKSNLTGDLGSELSKFNRSRLPEILRILDTLKYLGESETISKLLHTRV